MIFSSSEKTSSPESFDEKISSLTQKEEAISITVRGLIVELGKVLCEKKNHKLLYGVTVLTALTSACQYITPYLLRKIIQNFATLSPMFASTLLASFIASSVFSLLFSSWRQILSSNLNNNILKTLLQKSVNHFLQRSLDFHTQTSSSTMFNLIQKSFMIHSLGETALTKIFPTLVELSVFFVFLASQFGVLVGTSLVLLIASYVIYSIWATQKIIRFREEAMIVWNQTFENVGGILAKYKLMRDYNQSERTLTELTQILKKLKTTNNSAVELSENVHLGYGLLSHLHLSLLSLYLIGTFNNRNSLISSISNLYHFANTLPSFGEGVAQLFTNYPDLRFVFSHLAMTSEILDPYPNIPLNIDQAPEISFQNICFNYPSGEDSLFKNLSFTVPAGSKVSLVSCSGAGKTSIFHLLYRYYSPSEGLVTINGQDISKVGLDSLQNQICLVGQNSALFQGSLRDNILYGTADPATISDEALYALASSIGLEDFFDECQKGLDTDVGEGGKALSGGQQQKVAIIRSLLKPAKIRLLDEPTASLDNLSAARILNFLLDQKQDVTTLFITHKLTEARRAELILFLEDGKVIAQGTHEELLNTCVPYQKLWKAQSHEQPDDVL